MPTYQNMSNVTQRLVIVRSSGIHHTYSVPSLRFLHLTDVEYSLIDPDVLQPPIWSLSTESLPPPSVPRTNTDDVPEGTYNKYYHESVAKEDLITPYIIDGETRAPTSNAVYDLMNKQTDLLCGVITTSGSGSLRIPCKRGQPLVMSAVFSDPTPPPPGCGPVLVDSVTIDAEQVVPYPIWAIIISWDIQNSVREITWEATVTRG